jgi:hypothetical protein
MHATKLFGTVGVTAGLTVASIAVAGAASAGPPVEHVKFHEETTEIVEDFCDVPGLTVRLDRVLDGKFLGKTRGPDDLPFAVEHTTFRDVWTNPANGNFVSVFAPEIFQIHKLTINADGTTTVIEKGTGNFVAYGPDGKAIARNPGQTRLELLFDVDGTFLGVVRVIKESTGRTEDFCEAAVPVLIG